LTNLKLTEKQKEFLASKSKLSSGSNNLRFKGTIKTNFYLRSCSEQCAGALE